MAVNDPRDRVEDVEEQLFWKEIKEAVKHVELNHGLDFDIERGTRRAVVSWIKNFPKENDFNAEYVEIILLDIEPKQPALLVP